MSKKLSILFLLFIVSQQNPDVPDYQYPSFDECVKDCVDTPEMSCLEQCRQTISQKLQQEIADSVPDKAELDNLMRMHMPIDPGFEEEFDEMTKQYIDYDLGEQYSKQNIKPGLKRLLKEKIEDNATFNFRDNELLDHECSVYTFDLARKCRDEFGSFEEGKDCIVENMIPHCFQYACDVGKYTFNIQLPGCRNKK